MTGLLPFSYGAEECFGALGGSGVQESEPIISFWVFGYAAKVHAVFHDLRIRQHLLRLVHGVKVGEWVNCNECGVPIFVRPLNFRPALKAIKAEFSWAGFRNGNTLLFRCHVLCLS